MPLNANLVIMPGADTGALSRGLAQGVDMSNAMFKRKQDEYQQGRQEAKDRREDSLRGAMSGAFSYDEKTGRMQYSKDGLAGVAKVDPEVALQLQQQQDQQAAAQRKAMIEQQHQQSADIASALNGVKDQASYEMAMKYGHERGFAGMDKMPRQYDPNFVNHIRSRALTHQEYTANQLKQMAETRQATSDKAENALKYAQADKLRAEAKSAKNDPTSAMNLTEGEKAVDKDFAKDYNEWTSGGSKIAQTEIQKLRGIANDLKGGAVTTGGLTGVFPDRMTSDSVLKARADVQSTVMNSLRAILGAQFTEKEGERIIKNTWNEGDSTENNLARVNRLVGDLESKANAKSAKARYFEKNGTLHGFKAGAVAEQPETKEWNGVVYKQVNGHWVPQGGPEVAGE